MSLHVVIGFSKPGCKGDPSVVYCGRSAASAIAARDADTEHASFELLQNVIGIRKDNSRHVPPPANVEVETEAKTEPETETGETSSKRRKARK